MSKGTFYFHFAHKEDILLEMPWATVEIMAEEAEQAMELGTATADLVDQIMTSLANRVLACRGLRCCGSPSTGRGCPTSGRCRPPRGASERCSTPSCSTRSSEESFPVRPTSTSWRPCSRR